MSNLSSFHKKGLTAKDLITTGIFTAILFVTILAGGMIFAVNPVLTFYMPLGGAVLGGPVFLLLIAKAPKRGIIIISSVLIAIIWFATGMHWAFALGYFVMGLISEVVAGMGQYKSSNINILAYMLFSLGATGSYILYFINPASWASYMLQNGTEKSYIDTMNASAHIGVLIIMIAGTLLIAGLSGLVGKKLLHKQFEKAGITA